MKFIIKYNSKGYLSCQVLGCLCLSGGQDKWIINPHNQKMST